MAKEKKIEIELPVVEKIAKAAVAVSKAEIKEKQEKKEEANDLQKNWWDKSKYVLIRDKGILRVLTSIEEIEIELKKKKNWDYRIIDKTEQFMLIDYEKDEARFYVKALLAKVNKLKEVKMLWMVIFVLILFFLTHLMTFIIVNYRITDLQKNIVQQSQKAPIQMPVNTYSPNAKAEDPFQSLNSQNKNGKSSTGGENELNNHLFQ